MATINRRSLLRAPLFAALGASAVARETPGAPNQRTPGAVPPHRPAIANGPFQPTVDSLKTYQTPEWFRDAKFGIWAHWGPQAVPRSGDWYARWMYVPGHPHYAHHLKHYGHPSEAGYKDIIVSKNGNLLLNVALYPDGSLPPQSQTLLTELAPWMKINAEAIHGTRPWTVHGEGPTETASGAFKESAEYNARDIRFTTKGETLYAITLGEPQGSVAITALGRAAGHEKRAVRSVRLLGVRAALKFQQTDAALVIDLPQQLPTRHASAFKISFA